MEFQISTKIQSIMSSIAPCNRCLLMIKRPFWRQNRAPTVKEDALDAKGLLYGPDIAD